jgi:hypothetical protein
MNFKRLVTWLMLGAAGITPLATAQNPVILQGNYVSNVFGQSNFILNPNAQTNTANVTVSNATVTRSTTTPLVATSEFLITTSTATGFADWATRTFDAGMRNQNCEARFSYRGFSVGSTTVQIRQGSNTVAQLTLTASTDPRIASINFPCGDLSSATTLRVQQATASLTGTNELSGLYLGLATNQANVAQAETVLIVNRQTNQSIPHNSDTTVLYTTENLDVNNEYDTATGIFTAKRAGRYFITAQTLFNTTATWASGETHELKIVKGSTTISSNRVEIQVTPTSSPFQPNQVNATIELAVGDTIKINLYQSSGAALDLFGSEGFNRLQISRFPTSSELVVTPERQNVWGGVEWNAAFDFQGTATSYTTVNVGTNWGTPSLVGNATAAGTLCGLTANDVGFCIDTLPPGTYKIGGNFQLGVRPTASGNFCAYSANIGGGTLSENRVVDALPRASASAVDAVNFVNLGSGLVKITSLQRNVRVWLNYRKDAGSANCTIRSDNTNYYAKPSLHITPVDQPSNSALYVQGPVQASATGAAIPAGFQNNIVGTINSGLGVIVGSGGSWRTGTGITLTPGIWEIKVMALIGNVAPSEVRAGITDAPNSAPINDSTGFSTTMFTDDAGNTCCVLYTRTEGIFYVTTTKTFYPVALAYPAGANFNYDFSIRARQLN